MTVYRFCLVVFAKLDSSFRGVEIHRLHFGPNLCIGEIVFLKIKADVQLLHAILWFIDRLTN